MMTEQGHQSYICQLQGTTTRTYCAMKLAMLDYVLHKLQVHSATQEVANALIASGYALHEKYEVAREHYMDIVAWYDSTVGAVYAWKVPLEWQIYWDDKITPRLAELHAMGATIEGL